MSKDKEACSGFSLSNVKILNHEVVVGEDSRNSAGTILCVDSITHGDMVQGNFRFHENLRSMMANKLWSTISKLGVMFDGEEGDLAKNGETQECNNSGKIQEQKELSKSFRRSLES